MSAPDYYICCLVSDCIGYSCEAEEHVANLSDVVDAFLSRLADMSILNLFDAYSLCANAVEELCHSGNLTIFNSYKPYALPVTYSVSVENVKPKNSPF